MSHKEQYGKSRLGMFISEASKSIPEIIGAGIKLASGDVRGAMSEVGGILTANKDRNEETKLLHQEFEIKKMDFSKECFALEVEDRKDARLLYKDDSVIQKIFSIVFLLGYGVLSWYLLSILMGANHMNKLAETMITMIWTGTSTKLGTIIDFLFGGSVNK